MKGTETTGPLYTSLTARLGLLLVVVVLASGCSGKPPEELIVGRWEMDIAATHQANPGGLAEYPEFWHEFGPDGAFASETPMTGTWQVVGKEGGKLIVLIAREGRIRIEEIQVKKNRLELNVPGGKVYLHLNRAGPVQVATAGSAASHPRIPLEDGPALRTLVGIDTDCTIEDRGGKRILKVGCGSPDDAPLAQIADALKSISMPIELNLSAEKVTDAGLAPLAGVPNLWALSLDSAISDDGLAHLKTAEKLRRLHVSGPHWSGRITDAGLAHLAGLTQMEELRIESDKITDAGIAHLAGMTRLRDLDIESEKITEAGYVHLQGMTEMENLRVGILFSLGDVGLPHLKRMTHLKKISILGSGGDGLSDAGMAELKNFKEMRELSLIGSKVSAAGLANLSGMKDLEHLRLLGCPGAAGDGLAFVKGLRNLKRLSLSYSPVDDASLKALAGLSSLEELDLSYTKVTDAGLVHLHGLQNLQRITTGNTTVTDGGIERLKETLPSLASRRKPSPQSLPPKP